MAITAYETICLALPRTGKKFIVVRILCDDVSRKFSLCHYALGMENGDKHIDLLIRPSVISPKLFPAKHFSDFG